jgi:hypothetical protein
MGPVTLRLVREQPWVENELHPKPVARGVELPPGQPDFYSYATSGNRIFGGYLRLAKGFSSFGGVRGACYLSVSGVGYRLPTYAQPPNLAP